ncbi:type II toxin-antitoxin system VapC family toxin [Parerythrobacter lacustris]|uniref:Type II toxin-antitoxin system VapC family toxin n=1 Tax=Parerythrobacter lacustris TaxID=2969984 RepID=A0ABT1XLM0_9SPHN|nr:type II toxin-antitoxin system VapC family toxin [Parerythrobacter lacustris]MCR2832555.1 type II toxin-antitoxin system VapC family toxin [Parerythrobacter lacustris]
MALLLDTHILAWFAAGDIRLKPHALDAILNPDTPLFVSAVVAWEYVELELRGRFHGAAPLGALLERLGAATLDYPAELWTLAAALPPIHRDPVDRMLVAHALALDMPLVTADADIRRYPIPTVW